MVDALLHPAWFKVVTAKRKGTIPVYGTPHRSKFLLWMVQVTGGVLDCVKGTVSPRAGRFRVGGYPCRASEGSSRPHIGGFDRIFLP
jgi:hypothetical protein